MESGNVPGLAPGHGNLHQQRQPEQGQNAAACSPLEIQKAPHATATIGENRS